MNTRKILPILALVLLLIALPPVAAGTAPGTRPTGAAAGPPRPDSLVVTPPALTATVLMDAVVTRTLTITNTGPATVNVALTTSIADDFSGDSGLWTYTGTAYRDTANGYAVLTEPVDGQVGQFWLHYGIVIPTTVQFRYRAGGGTGADGLVLMFYKDLDYELCPYGDALGFESFPGCDPVPGYGIEFDNYLNTWRNDPSDSHIALIKDSTSDHLASVDDTRVEDNQWHNVRVVIGAGLVTVTVDGGQVLAWQGTLDRTYAGLGFAGATGTTNNWHIVDDVVVGAGVNWLSIDPASAALPPYLSLAVEATFDAAGLQPGEFTTDLLVLSDDPAISLLDVPVTMMVEPRATMGWVEGVMTDACSDAPLEATLVALGQPYTITSDPGTGHYLLWLEAGSYSLRATAPGYLPVTVPIDIVAQQGTTQNLALSLEDAPCLVVAPSTLAATVLVGDVATRALTITNTGLAPVSVALSTTVIDDFSGDSGLWTYYGSAYRDAANSYVVLTEAVGWQVGRILLHHHEITGPISVQFRYRVGVGADDGDGFVLMFYKDPNYVPQNGGCLGFTAVPDCTPVPGYGIEFDGHDDPNYGDPSFSHIALIEDHVSNHLAWINDWRVRDAQWHDVQVEVGYDTVTVDVDGGQVLAWQGALDRTYAGFGFAGATSGDCAWHIVDDIVVSTPWLTVGPTDGQLPPGTSLLAEATFDAVGMEPGKYMSNLLVRSDDPATPLLVVPATMTITGVTLRPPAPAGQAARGRSVTYTEQLHNLTGRAGRFLLTTSGQLWSTTLSLTDTGPLAAGAGIFFTVQVTVPPGVAWYSTDAALVQATSASSPTVYTDTALFTTQAYAPPAITIAPAALTSTQEMGTVTTHTLAIANGNGVTMAITIAVILRNGQPPWLAVAPLAGTVPTSSTLPVAVTVDATDLQPGEYWAALLVHSNDPTAPWVRLPVTATVLPGAGMGWVEGTVAAALSGAPLAATIVALGQPYTVTSDHYTGHYILGLDPGSYALRAAPARDYYSQTVGGVIVISGTGTLQDFALTTLPPSAMLVDDDGDSPDVRSYYTATLDRLGQPYDLWDTAAWGDPTTEDLQGHDIVLWFTGAGRVDTFTAADEATVTGYLNAGTWYTETVDSGATWCSAVDSLALDEAGYPHIPYDHGGLAHAYLDATGWHTETVDSTGSDGSLALDAAGYPRIAYENAAGLAYAYLGVTGWHTQTVDPLGRDGSLALDAAGYPHIAYYDSGNADLRYAYLDAAGWHTQTVDSAGNVGTGASLALDSSGYPHISYWRDDFPWGADGLMKYAHLDATGWHSETVDTAYSCETPSFLALDANGLPHILYHGQGLVYAYNNGTAWITETVTGEESCLSAILAPNALVLDPAGRPHLLWAWSSGMGPSASLTYSYFDGSVWTEEGVMGTLCGMGNPYYGGLALDEAGSPHVAYSCNGIFDAGGLTYATRSPAGHFFLSSEDYLHEMGLTAFGQDSLGIITYTDDVSQTDVVGIPGSPIGDGLGLYTLTLPPGWSTLWTDVVSGTQSPFRWQGSGLNNSTNYEGVHFKTVFLGWPLEGLAGVEDRAEVLCAVLDWFGECGASCNPVQGADFSWQPVTPTVDEVVTFTGTVAAGDPPISYTWKLGVGSWMEGQVVTYTYATAGVYTVVMTATNCATATATAVHTVTVVCPEVSAAGFAWTPIAPEVGQAVTFTAVASSTRPLTYTWKLDVGSWMEGQVVTHTYDLPGLYTVTLTATNDCGSWLAVTDTLTVIPSCQGVSILSVTTDISGCAVTLGAELSGDPPFTYLWDFGAFGTSTATNPLVYFGVDGTYTGTLSVWNCGSAEPATSAFTVEVVCSRWTVHLPLVLRGYP